MLLDGYVRVSQVRGRAGEAFISPSVQREQIERWITAQGFVLGEVFEELDESGGRADRPLLLKALDRVEAHASGGIVVARLDRFGRSLIDGLSAIERITKSGGVFVSVQDGLDVRTDTGKLVLRIMLAMGEWELDRIRSNWNTAKLRAIQRGVFLGATAPFGYRRRTDGRLAIDATTGPFLRELFRRRREGSTVSQLCRWLEEERIPTARGNPGWSFSVVSRILENRVYLGELKSGMHVAPNSHPALVDRVLWQGAQNPRILERGWWHKTPTLLGGLLRCAGCQMALHSGTTTLRSGQRAANYACYSRSAAGRCPEPAYVTGPTIEPLIEEAYFGELSHSPDSQAADRSRLHELEAEVANAERQLATYRDSPSILDALGDSRYVEGLRTRAAAVDRLGSQLAAQSRRLDREPQPAIRATEDEWPRLSIAERKRMIAEVFDTIFIRRGWGNVEQRVIVCASGHAPPGLPSPGNRRSEGRPLDPKQVKSLKLRRPRRWAKSRIESNLRAFVGDRSDWPSRNEFLRAGFGPLFAQVVRTGGPEYWSQMLDVRPPRGNTGIRAWTAPLAREALQGFVRGRQQMPTRAEFIKAGYRGLYNWLYKNGGRAYWAEQCGLTV